MKIIINYDKINKHNKVKWSWISKTMTTNSKAFNLFAQTWQKPWPPVECFCYCCPILFLLSKTLLYSLLFSKHYCLVQNKKCHRTILVSNLPSLGTSNLSRKGLIMPGEGLPRWTGAIVETEEAFLASAVWRVGVPAGCVSISPCALH